MSILEKAVVITSTETTDYTITKELGDTGGINTVLATIPVTKGAATYAIVDGKPTFTWVGVGGARFIIYILGMGFEVNGVATPGLVPAGAWNNATVYKINELVTDNGSTYRSKQGNNSNKVVTDTAWWEVFASRGFAGNGTFYTTANLTTNTVPSHPISGIVLPSGKALQVGDLVLVANELASNGRVYRVVSITGANCALQFISTFRGNDGNDGDNGTGIYTTTSELNTTGQTLALSNVNWALPPQVGDLVISTHASSTGVIHQLAAISGTNGTFIFLTNVRGLEGFSEFPTTAQLALSGTSSINTSTITIPSGRSLKVGDFVTSNHANSPSVKHRVTAVSGSTVTTAFFVNGRGAAGLNGDPGGNTYHIGRNSGSGFGSTSFVTNIPVNKEVDVMVTVTGIHAIKGQSTSIYSTYRAVFSFDATSALTAIKGERTTSSETFVVTTGKTATHLVFGISMSFPAGEQRYMFDAVALPDVPGGGVYLAAGTFASSVASVVTTLPSGYQPITQPTPDWRIV